MENPKNALEKFLKDLQTFSLYTILNPQKLFQILLRQMPLNQGDLIPLIT